MDNIQKESEELIQKLQKRIDTLGKQKAAVLRQKTQLINENNRLNSQAIQYKKERQYWKGKCAKQEIQICTLSLAASESVTEESVTQESQEEKYYDLCNYSNKKRKLNDSTGINCGIKEEKLKKLEQQLENTIIFNEKLKQKINTIEQIESIRSIKLNKAIQCELLFTTDYNLDTLPSYSSMDEDEENESKHSTDQNDNGLLSSHSEDEDEENDNGEENESQYSSDSDDENVNISQHSSDLNFIDDEDDNVLMTSNLDGIYIPSQAPSSSTSAAESSDEISIDINEETNDNNNDNNE